MPLSPHPLNRRSPFNLPNALTSARIAAIPGVIYLLYGNPTPSDRFWAAVLFGLALWTDFFDGLLARRMQTITRLGKILDPVADKLMVIAALIMLVHFGYVDVLVVILLISREVAVNALRTLAGAEGITIHSTFSGRLKVFGEGFGIGFLLLGPENLWLDIEWMELGRILLYLSLGLALWSAAIYFRDYYRGAFSSSDPS